MPCYHPLTAYRSLSQGGKVVFSPPSPFAPEIQLPCGQCIGCRLDRSRKWALRCVHEASLYEKNCFVTLTYSDVHLPRSGSLEKGALSGFIKRLRKRHGSGIRFYACGEYGGQFGRPHFHVCLFNFEPADKFLWSVRDGVRLYVSPDLDALWSRGFVTVGDVTFESAAYVARYVMKKLTGPKAAALQCDGAPGPYTRVNAETGEIYQVEPEFNLMSRRPGIGKPWLDKYMTDVYPDDFVVLRGVKMKPPRYYDDQFGKIFIDAHAEMKAERRKVGRLRAWDNTPERLKVREVIAQSRLTQLKRTLDNDL